MPFKTTVNWLFNDIYCYLVISCCDRKIGVFQQTVVRVYCILKGRNYSQKKCGRRLFKKYMCFA